MNLEVSRYNIFFEHNGVRLLYNTETNAFIKLENKLYNKLNSKHVCQDDFDNHTLEYLLKSKIIIEKSTIHDYYYQKKFQFNMECYSQNTLSLTILPTTNCNCDCPYCFEQNKSTKMMSENIIDNLLSFIHQHTNAKTLDLCWYGGEPLMGFNVIKKIWSKLEKEIKLELRNHQIITNGYLITDEVIDFFNLHPLTEIQITLDGRKEIHDSRRVLKGSHKGTFDVILNNIKKVSKAWSNTHITIRVNIDNENKEDFVYIRKLIEEWNYSNIYIYPGFIRSEENECIDNKCKDLTHKNIQDFYFSLPQKGIDVSFFYTPINRGCVMNGLNCYLIGPEGEIYKCWNEVGDKTKIIGNICNDKIVNLPLLSKYMSASSLFDDDKCKECNLFPICSGGCPRRRVNNLFFGEKHNLCCLYKDNNALIYALKNYYDILKSKKNLQKPIPFK